MWFLWFKSHLCKRFTQYRSPLPLYSIQNILKVIGLWERYFRILKVPSVYYFVIRKLGRWRSAKLFADTWLYQVNISKIQPQYNVVMLYRYFNCCVLIFIISNTAMIRCYFRTCVFKNKIILEIKLIGKIYLFYLYCNKFSTLNGKK